MILLPKQRKAFLEWARTNTTIFSISHPLKRFAALHRAKKYFLLQRKDVVLLNQLRQTKRFNHDDNTMT